MRRRILIPIFAACLFVAAVAVGAQTPLTDRQALSQICQLLVGQGVATGCVTTTASTTTTLASTTTLATTTTTGATTTTQAVATVSVVVFNGNRARVLVTPNTGAIVTIRNPAGVIVSTGSSGDVPAAYCCSPGTYTWTAAANPGFVASPPSGSFTVSAVTTTTAAGTTTTTAAGTTTTQPSGARSYVNPVNTGNKATGLTVSGNMTINTDQTLSNLRINGRLLVTSGAHVTLTNVTVAPTDDSQTAAISVRGGAHLIISHFTVTHCSTCWSHRGIETMGGTFSASFGDISGTEDGVNISSAGAGLIILDNSWVHDLKASPPGGASPASPHHDGIQVSGGNVLIDRSVFQKIKPSTAAIFPKPDFGDVTLTVRDTYASGGGYTIYEAEGCSSGGCTSNDVEVWWENVELNPYPICNCGGDSEGSRWGAVLGARYGGIAHEVGLGHFVVTFKPGEPGFHPGPQN